MKKSIIFVCLLAAILTGCVTVQIIQPTAMPPVPTLKPQPTSQPPTMPPLPTFTPIPPATSKPTQAGASEVKIFLIAIGDNGASGKKIGCNDSVIPIKVQIQPTLGVLRAALTKLFELYGQKEYGASSLSNALYQSNLSIESLNIVNREAIIHLKGSLVLGGVCDDPRVKAQLEEIALQFSSVDKASVFINGVPLNQLLSGQG
jgi:hypothetical protein